jgi:prepilin-type N-terminal cleavage/methylation domain-containing protein
MKKKKQDQRGFTLIEALISLCILSVALLGMSSMVFSVIQATAQSKETTTATTLLQDKMENLKNTNISLLPTGTFSETVSLGNITGTRQWAISTVGNLKTITVTVNWTSRGPHGVSFTTLRGQ